MSGWPGRISPAQNIFFQMYLPGGEPRFSRPVNVSSNPGVFSWLPRMVISGAERQRMAPPRRLPRLRPTRADF